jgi:ribonuclease VapC
MDRMESSRRKIAVDSSALIAMHWEEVGHELLFEKVIRADEVIVSATTVLEVAMVLTRKFPLVDPRSALTRDLKVMQAQIIAVTEGHAEIAVHAFLRYGKGRHPARLNFGDCLSYAIASLAGIPLLYTGDDFAKTDIEAA